MSNIQIAIPDTVQFADLKLSFEQGAVSFDWTPIEIICGHNGLSVDIFKAGPEDNVSTLIIHWYAEHLAEGGERNPVADELIAEVAAEDAVGLNVAQPPLTNQ